MSVNEYSKEINFLKSLTENNQNMFDTYYIICYICVPLAEIEPLQSNMPYSESQIMTQMKEDCTLDYSAIHLSHREIEK